MPAEFRDQLQAALGASYSLERELGGGGMSRVFLATERSLGRTVVVKVLPPDMAGHISGERFNREITLAAQLQHPHIVPLLSAGAASDLPFYTMPYVRGESLRERLSRDGELPVAESVRMLREIASALAFAHSEGVIHRDIKPENILISGGSAMVTDFGVAKAVSAAKGETSGLTSLGVALGTPAYMSPEQASADPTVDHRADIYSWGVVAYELLTGQTPFALRSPQAMLAAHVTETPEQVTKRRPTIPASLAQLVMQCLEKRASDRPQTADALVHALDQLTTPAGMQPARPRTSAIRRRLPLLIGLPLAAIILVAGWSAYRARAGTSAPIANERRIAVMPFANVARDSSTEALGDGIAEELTTALGKVPTLHLASREAVLVFRDSASNPQHVGQRLGVDYLLTGTIQRSSTHMKVTTQLLRAGDGLSAWSGSYVLGAGDMFAIEDSIAKAIVGELRVTLGATQQSLVTVETQSTEAHDLYLQGRYYLKKFTDADIQRGIALLEKASALDPRYAAPQAAISEAWVWRAGNWDAPLQAYPKAKRAALLALQLDSANALAHVARAAIAFFYDWDSPAAEREFATAFRLDPQESIGAVAVVLLQQGKVDSAIAVSRRGVRVDPLSSLAASTLAIAFAQADQLDSAESWAQRGHDLDASNSNAIAVLATVRAQQHRWRDCLALVPAPTTSADGSSGSDTAGPVDTWRIACQAYAGQTTEARRELDALIATRKSHYVDAVAIASAYVALGDRDAAFKWLDQGFADHSDSIPFLLWRRMFDPIRGDARFKALEQRVAAAANKAP